MKSVGWVLCQTMLLELRSNAFRDRKVETGDIPRNPDVKRFFRSKDKHAVV